MVGGPGLWKSAKAGLIVILMTASVTWLFFQSHVQDFNECQTAYQCIAMIMNECLRGGLSMIKPNVNAIYD